MQLTIWGMFPTPLLWQAWHLFGLFGSRQVPATLRITTGVDTHERSGQLSDLSQPALLPVRFNRIDAVIDATALSHVVAGATSLHSSILVSPTCDTWFTLQDLGGVDPNLANIERMARYHGLTRVPSVVLYHLRLESPVDRSDSLGDHASTALSLLECLGQVEFLGTANWQSTIVPNPLERAPKCWEQIPRRFDDLHEVMIGTAELVMEMDVALRQGGQSQDSYRFMSRGNKAAIEFSSSVLPMTGVLATSPQESVDRDRVRESLRQFLVSPDEATTPLGATGEYSLPSGTVLLTRRRANELQSRGALAKLAEYERLPLILPEYASLLGLESDDLPSVLVPIPLVESVMHRINAAFSRTNSAIGMPRRIRLAHEAGFFTASREARSFVYDKWLSSNNV